MLISFRRMNLRGEDEISFETRKQFGMDIYENFLNLRKFLIIYRL